MITKDEIIRRAELVRDNYEAFFDGEVPGSTSDPARYVLVSENMRAAGNGLHFYVLNYCPSVYHVERAARSNVPEGRQPVCYYDLHVLTPLPAVRTFDLYTPAPERHPIRYMLSKIAISVSFNTIASAA